jgi:hypothetical protein
MKCLLKTKQTSVRAKERVDTSAGMVLRTQPNRESKVATAGRVLRPQTTQAHGLTIIQEPGMYCWAYFRKAQFN